MTERQLHLDRNLHVIFGVTLMAILGVASIAPAFPQIVRELGISEQAVGMLITVFTLPGVLLAPVVGVLADRLGRKRVLVPSLFLYGIAGGACAFVADFKTVLALRFFQGVGAASLGILNVTLIGDLFSGRQRATAMGYNASVLSVGTGAFPVIGGSIALLGWNYPFLLALLAIPVGLFVLLALDNPEPTNSQTMREYFGQLWQTVNDRRSLALFAAAISTFIILYGSFLTYFPILLGTEFGASSATIGLLMSCMSIVTAIVSSQIGRLSDRFAQRKLLVAAYIVYAAAVIAMPHMPTLWLFVLPIALYGIGHGLNLPSLMTLLTGLAPPEQRAAFMSVWGMTLRVGQTLGPLVMGLVFTVSGDILGATFYAGAICALVTAALIAMAFRDRS